MGAGCQVTPRVGDDDGEWAFGAFFQERPVGFVVLVGAVGVEELHAA